MAKLPCELPNGAYASFAAKDVSFLVSSSDPFVLRTMNKQIGIPGTSGPCLCSQPNVLQAIL